MSLRPGWEVESEILGKHKGRKHGDHAAFRAQGRRRFTVRQCHEGYEGSGDLAARGHDVSRGLWHGRRLQGVRGVGIRAARAKIRRAPETDPAETQNRVVARAPAAAHEEHLQGQVVLSWDFRFGPPCCTSYAFDATNLPREQAPAKSRFPKLLKTQRSESS